MRLIKIIISIVVIFLMGCTNTNKNMNIKGQLLYTIGDGTINSIKFISSGLNFLSFYKNDDVVTINKITRIDQASIIFDECFGKCIIKQYFPDTGDSKILRHGYLPSYIPNHNKLFFYDKTNDNEKWLFMTSMEDRDSLIKIAKEPNWRTLPNGISQPITTPVIQISEDEVVFIGDHEELWKFNIKNSELMPTEVNKGCIPILWREKHNQLLCADMDTWNPYLIDLNTNIKIEMPELNEAYGFVYIPKYDALIYGKTRSTFLIAEAYDIFLYTFLDKKEKRIKKNSHISGGMWIKE